MIIGLAGIGMVLVLGSIICYLFTLRVPAARRATATLAPSPRPAFPLPTAPLPTHTPGPPAPQTLLFTAQEPITGFSSCATYGFKGRVTAGNGSGLQGVQIVVWQNKQELLALDTTNAEGNYSIEIKDPPALRKLWIQIYQNDEPVSLPVFVETQIDCQNGFQLFQVDWQEATP